MYFTVMYQNDIMLNMKTSKLEDAIQAGLLDYMRSDVTDMPTPQEGIIAEHVRVHVMSRFVALALEKGWKMDDLNELKKILN